MTAFFIPFFSLEDERNDGLLNFATVDCYLPLTLEFLKNPFLDRENRTGMSPLIN
jgi:hypothetical protein